VIRKNWVDIMKRHSSHGPYTRGYVY